MTATWVIAHLQRLTDPFWRSALSRCLSLALDPPLDFALDDAGVTGKENPPRASINAVPNRYQHCILGCEMALQSMPERPDLDGGIMDKWGSWRPCNTKHCRD